MGLYAFSLKHNSLLFAILTPSFFPHSFISFSVELHMDNIFYVFTCYNTQYLTSNLLYIYIYIYIYIWRERERCILAPCIFSNLFLFFSFFFQTSKVRQDNKCHWCLLELWTPLAAIGFQGNTLTINFQLKQTKSWQHRLYGRCQESVLIYDKWA